jgi:hypothetical protein
MKKILVLLLILAVAGGVFALDGEWSLSGKAEIGSTFDFEADPISATGSGYNYVYDGWGNIDGQLALNYSWDALSLGMDYNYGGGIGGNLEYDGGNYKFQVNAPLNRMIVAALPPQPWEGRLWGSYTMLSGLFLLEAAYNSRDTEWWTSDKTAAFNSVVGLNEAGDDLASFGSIALKPWAGGDTFTKVDHGNFLLGSVELENLSFGVQLPNVFRGARQDLIENVLRNMVAGFTFKMQPVEVAAQFQMGNFGVYFGLRWFLGPITVGGSFTGIFRPQGIDLVGAFFGFDDDVDLKMFKFGGSVEYGADAFGAKVGAYYGLVTFKDSVDQLRNTQIGIEPSFWYNVIPTHLRFETMVGFYLNGGKEGTTKMDTEVGWAVQPQLFWNFLGTGAGGYWDVATGMVARYRLVGGDDYEIMADNNKLDVTFKWSF